MAPEQVIQFIWKNRLYSRSSLETSCGCDLEIISPGEQNHHAGPDFFNARIRLDHIIWAGNVEIHRRASDWYRHGHHMDPGYNNVILHVVGEYDTDVTNSLGRRIHTFVPRYHRNIMLRYQLMKESESWLPCCGYISEVPPRKLNQILRALLAERINQKCHHIERILHDPAKSREEIIYMSLASGFGLPVNTMPFELLSKGVPFSYLIEHRDSLSDLEAILFGRSGLLYSARSLGPYPASLWNRYQELKVSLTGKRVPPHLWRFLRLRPASFPTIRISQFASLIHGRFPVEETILKTASNSELEQIFRTCASEYWNSHYLFGQCSSMLKKYPGEQFITTLIINVVVPYLIALAKNGKCSDAGIRADQILHHLKAENNRIIKNWNIFGIRAGSANESQALIQLYNVYCSKRRCLDCQIGTEIMGVALHKV